MVWIHIRTDVLLFLIWVETVRYGYPNHFDTLMVFQDVKFYNYKISRVDPAILEKWFIYIKVCGGLLC